MEEKVLALGQRRSRRDMTVEKGLNFASFAANAIMWRQSVGFETVPVEEKVVLRPPVERGKEKIKERERVKAT